MKKHILNVHLMFLSLRTIDQTKTHFGDRQGFTLHKLQVGETQIARGSKCEELQLGETPSERNSELEKKLQVEETRQSSPPVAAGPSCRA